VLDDMWIFPCLPTSNDEPVMNEPVIRYSCSFRTLGSSREESRRRSLARRELRREKDMRKIALTLTAAAGIVGAVSLSSNRAEATILDASAAIHQATGGHQLGAAGQLQWY
jgi:hypothetical protein